MWERRADTRETASFQEGGWLFQFGTDMDIVEPEALKEEYINRAMALCRKG